jgi:predicted nuclease with TOPRIM domain
MFSGWLFLEKDLAEKQSIATELASKEAEIKQLRFEIDELSKHSSRWEIAASESSAQVLKMANQIEETQHSVAALERQLKDTQVRAWKVQGLR